MQAGPGATHVLSMMTQDKRSKRRSVWWDPRWSDDHLRRVASKCTKGHDMLSISRFSHKEFRSLREAWTQLESGPDMTAFQSFEWFALVNEHFAAERLSRSLVRAVYYLVSDEAGEPVLIAPLRIHLVPLSKGHPRGIHLLGRNGYSDYLNFIYQDFDPSAAALVARQAAADFGIRQFVLERLVADTACFQWLVGQPGASMVEHEAVQLSLPESLAEYQATLSKSTRQNIRTAWNRLRTDGVELTIAWGDASVGAGEAAAFATLKQQRETNRRRRNRGVKGLVLDALRSAYFSVLFSGYNEAGEAMGRLENPWFLRVSAGEELCAFAFGLADRFGANRVLRVLQVGIDESFGRYSPGLIGLHEFISQEIAEGRPNFDVVDFTRGGERYKYDLGGSQTTLADVRFTHERVQSSAAGPGVPWGPARGAPQ